MFFLRMLYFSHIYTFSFLPSLPPSLNLLSMSVTVFFSVPVCLYVSLSLLLLLSVSLFINTPISQVCVGWGVKSAAGAKASIHVITEIYPITLHMPHFNPVYFWSHVWIGEIRLFIHTKDYQAEKYIETCRSLCLLLFYSIIFFYLCSLNPRLHCIYCWKPRVFFLDKPITCWGSGLMCVNWRLRSPPYFAAKQIQTLTLRCLIVFPGTVWWNQCPSCSNITDFSRVKARISYFLCLQPICTKKKGLSIFYI